MPRKLKAGSQIKIVKIKIFMKIVTKTAISAYNM